MKLMLSNINYGDERVKFSEGLEAMDINETKHLNYYGVNATVEIENSMIENTIDFLENPVGWVIMISNSGMIDNSKFYLRSNLIYGVCDEEWYVLDVSSSLK